MSYDLQSVYGSGFGGGGGNSGGGNSYGRLESSAPAPGLLSYPGPSYEVSESASCAGGACGMNEHKDITYSGSVLSNRNAPTTPVLTRILVVLVSLSLILSLSLLILAAMHSK